MSIQVDVFCFNLIIESLLIDRREYQRIANPIRAGFNLIIESLLIDRTNASRTPDASTSSFNLIIESLLIDRQRKGRKITMSENLVSIS